MGQRFDPQMWLKRVFPKGIEKSGLLNDKLEIKKTYIKALVRATAVSQRKLTQEIYKTVDFYLEKEARLKSQGVKSFKQEALNGQALLTERIKNFLVYCEVQEQKKAHKGRMYRWLPSSAKEPDPEHQLLYGKVFDEGEGDKEGHMPGERWGCQCGIEWLDGEDMTPQEKIESIKIDFRRNSFLPGLNSKELKEIGAKSKEIRREYEAITGRALYKPILPPIQDIKKKNYWHFIGELKDHKKGFVLLDTDPKKNNFEIVHILKMKEKTYRQFLRKYFKNK